jgi:Na+/H+ antiporter NhaB
MPFSLIVLFLIATVCLFVSILIGSGHKLGDKITALFPTLRENNAKSGTANNTIGLLVVAVIVVVIILL